MSIENIVILKTFCLLPAGSAFYQPAMLIELRYSRLFSRIVRFRRAPHFPRVPFPFESFCEGLAGFVAVLRGFGAIYDWLTGSGRLSAVFRNAGRFQASN